MQTEVIITEKQMRELTAGPSLSKEEQEELEQAQKVLAAVAARIRRKHILLGVFMNVLQLVAVRNEILLESDGKHLYYQPAAVLQALQSRRLKQLEEHWLHILAHGILGHFGECAGMKMDEILDRVLDWKAGYFLTKMNWISGKKEQPEFGTLLNQGIKNTVYCARGNAAVGDWLRKLPAGPDDHGIWSGDKTSLRTMEILQVSLEGEPGTSWKEAFLIAFGGLPGNLEQTMEGFQTQMGSRSDAAGSREDVYQASRDNHRSYADILREFFCEACQEDAESIDRMIYTFGFQMYGDVALIEPEEENESRKLHTLVIALDSSGSCDGKIMQDFLREVRNLLRDIRGKVSFEQISLLQCDTRIQKEQSFHTPEELPVMDRVKICGFGGTDFTPVFDRVEEMRKKEQKQVDCLLYLTDTYGRFPETKPEYPVFLITPGGERSLGTPAWAKVLKMD